MVNAIRWAFILFMVSISVWTWLIFVGHRFVPRWRSSRETFGHFRDSQVFLSVISPSYFQYTHWSPSQSPSQQTLPLLLRAPIRFAAASGHTSANIVYKHTIPDQSQYGRATFTRTTPAPDISIAFSNAGPRAFSACQCRTFIQEYWQRNSTFPC